MEPMKVGLMGLGRGGRSVADALIASSWCKLVAVASLQSKRVEQFTEAHPGIAAHNDLRSLIVASPLDALFVAVPPFLRTAYLPFAAERHIPVFMLTPAGRTFAEALTLTEQFEVAQCPIVVTRSWGIEPALHDDVIQVDRLGRLFLAHGTTMLCLEENFDWRGDAQRAGGGVLLYSAYGLIDVLVQAIGLPSSVYATTAMVSRPGTRFAYDTEDTATAVFRYANGAMATVSACWTASPPTWLIDLKGTQQSLHIDEQWVTLCDREGNELSRLDRPANPLAAQIDEFLGTLRSNPRQLPSTLRQHLPTMAVIQAAYLSARTGQPESPGVIFTMHNVKPPPAPKPT